MTTEDTMSDAEADSYDRRERIRWAKERGETFSALADHIEYDRPPSEGNIRRALLVQQAINDRVEMVYGEVQTRNFARLEFWCQETNRTGRVISVTYRDYDGDHCTYEFPVAYLWMTADAVKLAEAEKRLAAQREAEEKKAAERRARLAITEAEERTTLARLKAKYEKESRP